MSSDSEDDIFGNAAKKLKRLCSKSEVKKLNSCEILSDPPKIVKNSKSNSNSNSKVNYVSPPTSINDLVILSDDDINQDNLFKNHAQPKKSDYPSDLGDSDTEQYLQTHRKPRRRQRVRKSKRLSSKTFSDQIVDLTNMTEINTNNSPVEKVQTKKKTKRKTKNLKPTRATNTRNNLSESIENIHTVNSRRPGLRPRSLCPIISIGNTAEYTDQSEDIQLFSSKPNILEDIVILDDNEEVTVHVHWQNDEVFKFNLRKFQKFRQVFEFFAKKENVSEKRLYFEYDDAVFTCDDSPDSIKYNISKFIEGGLNSSHLSNLVLDTVPHSIKPNSIQIKFQCQDFKKPYESTIELNEKLSLAMVKCAEHFEKPLNILKFEFDGERIIGTTTAKELELICGDCIDVKIIK